MALEYGAGRQIGRYDFHDSGNAFDGLRLVYRLAESLSIDALAVQIRRSPAQPEKERSLLGGYAVARPVRVLRTEVYYLHLRDSDPDLKASLQTMGGRGFWQILPWLTVDGEAALQVGSLRPKGFAEAADHFASSALLQLRAEKRRGLALATWLQVQRMSGDPNAADDLSHAWRPLYPSLDELTGLLQLFPPSNLLQGLAGVRLGRRESLAATAELRANGALAGSQLAAFGQPVVPGKAPGWSYVGSEASLRLEWQAARALHFLLAGGVFVPSRALAEETGLAWARQVLLQWTGRF
jgi:hypothetical protein